MTTGMGLARIGPMLMCCAALGACAAPLAQTGPRMDPAPTGDQRTLGALSAAATPVSLRSGRAATAEASGSGAERAFVTGILRDLQMRSFAANAELCGYIGLDSRGNLMATPAMQGTEASCTLPQVPPGMVLLASFHTHGTYSPYYASEFPTTTDMLTDASDRIDGYISTPGGRLWHVDSDTMTARQLCGRGCLPQDPDYVAADDGPVREMFTLAELRAFERS